MLISFQDLLWDGGGKLNRERDYESGGEKGGGWRVILNHIPVKASIHPIIPLIQQ